MMTIKCRVCGNRGTCTIFECRVAFSPELEEAKNQKAKEEPTQGEGENSKFEKALAEASINDRFEVEAVTRILQDLRECLVFWAGLSGRGEVVAECTDLAVGNAKNALANLLYSCENPLEKSRRALQPK